jgi:hypothetical protein
VENPQPLDDERVVLCAVTSEADCSMHKLLRVPRTFRSQAEVPNTARIYVDVGLGAPCFPNPWYDLSDA